MTQEEDDAAVKAAIKADLDRKIIHLAFDHDDCLFNHPKTKGEYIALQNLLLHQHKIQDANGMLITAMQLMPTKLMLEDKVVASVNDCPKCERKGSVQYDMNTDNVHCLDPNCGYSIPNSSHIQRTCDKCGKHMKRVVGEGRPRWICACGQIQEELI